VDSLAMAMSALRHGVLPLGIFTYWLVFCGPVMLVWRTVLPFAPMLGWLGFAVMQLDPGAAAAVSLARTGLANVERRGAAGGLDGGAVCGGTAGVEGGQGLPGGCGQAVAGVWGLG
jgi:hypothetical protein